MGGAVARDGERVPTRGSSPGSVKKLNVYKIHPTPVLNEADGVEADRLSTDTEWCRPKRDNGVVVGALIASGAR